jgi:hypothetical protein
MSFILRNFVFTSAVMMAGLAFCMLNPQTAEWHDLLRIALQAMHSKGAQEIFALGFLTSCTLDFVLSAGSVVSHAPVMHSHSVAYVAKSSED